MKSKNLKIFRVIPYVLLVAFVIASLNCKNSLFDWPPPLNREPVASFTAQNQKNTLQVQFSAAGSFDPDGKIVSYNWNFGDGSNGEGMDTFHNYQEEGKYFVKLRVRDDDDAEAAFEKEIEAYTNNLLPTAILSLNATTANVDFIWQFDGSASFDTDGYIDSYRFEIIRRNDGTVIKTFEGNQNLIVYTFQKAHLQGKSSVNFEIKLTVQDNRGESANTCKIVTVTDS
jgi:PKD repeat protein